MRTPITEKSKFWQIAPAADEIFTYLEKTPEIAGPWGFDQGNMSDDLGIVWADFSCVAISGWGRDKLSVTATKQADSSSWSLSHRLTRAP